MRPGHASATRRAALVGALALVLGACAGDPGPTTGPSDAAATATPRPTASATPTVFRIGLSDPLADDPWHAAMVCSALTQARVSGAVDRVVDAVRTTDSAGQAADIANLVSTGVDAIVLYPGAPAAVADAVQAARDAGVVVVSVGRPMDIEGLPSVVVDQEAYGYVGASWLFRTVGEKGNVMVLGGVTDDPVDAQHGAGRKRAKDETPSVRIVAETKTEGDPVRAVEQVNAFLETGKDLDGIWTSGTDSEVVAALSAAEVPLVPIVGGDRGPFVTQLIDDPGLVGAAVTDPPAIGAVGIDLALQLLAGRDPADASITVTPELWSNDTEEGRARLADISDPDLDLTWPRSVTLPPWTTYTADDVTACEGPSHTGG